MNAKYHREPWISPKVDARKSSIHGMGLFAKELILEGEVILIRGGEFVTKKEAFDAESKDPNLYIEQIDDDIFEVWTKEKSSKHGERDLSHFHNHSCDPNTWMKDEVTVIAMHDIDAGEEVTIDFAMSEPKEDRVLIDKCNCRSKNCRGIITGSDWKLPFLQKKYCNHFSPMLNLRISLSGSQSA